MNNLELLEIYYYENKKRYGNKKDGGYVIGELNTKYDCYISCGIANEESFTRDFLNEHNYLDKTHCYAFDGTINDYPWRYTKNIIYIKKNINIYNDNKNTNLKELINKYNNIFLSIDIEGGEYPWLLSINQEELKKFKQIVIEYHGLCGKDDWGTKYEDKIKCLEKLNKTHYIIHAHGNNYGSIENNIPNILEVTYVNKNCFLETPFKNMNPLPLNNLDYPNNQNKLDYKLNKYPFTNVVFSEIIIGSSDINTKTIKLGKTFPHDTELYFFHNYKDTFSYKIDKDKLIITRTDEAFGWGQNLIAYYL